MAEAKIRLSLDGAVSVVGGLNDVGLKISDIERLAKTTSGSVNNFAGSTDKLGVSAAQTAAAMRMIPAQMTDIIVSLQGGQKPLTVLLQQGGQLKDMFGGVGPAAKAMGIYVAGMINPLTLAAAAAGVLAVAYNEGSKESDAYTKALILTGNVAGTTASQLQGMAANISKTVGTQGSAAAALAEMAGTGRIAAGSLENFAKVAVQMERTVGQSIAETAKNLTELGKSPVDASEKLNEKYHYLTASVYAQIKALQDQGKTEEAGALAQKAYVDAFDTRSKRITENLGYVERGWISIQDAAKRGWDAMLNVGRKDTATSQLSKISDAIETTQAKLERVQKLGAGKDTKIRLVSIQGELDALRQQQSILQENARIEVRAGETAAKNAKLDEDRIAWDKAGDQYLSRRVQMEREIAVVREKGQAAGVSTTEIESRIGEVRKKYSDMLNTGIEALEQKQKLEKEILAGSLAALESNHKQALISDQDYVLAKQDISLKELAGEEAIAKKKAELAGGKKDLTERQKFVGEIAIIEQKRKNIISATQNEIGEIYAASGKAIAGEIAKWESATKTEQGILSDEAVLFGKSAEARKIAVEQIKVDSEARQFIAEQQKKNKSLFPDEIALILLEAEARKKNIAEIMGEQQALSGAEQLRNENKKFAAESIFDEKARAAALLEIDAGMWRERIQLAGDGTEAQQKLQSEFDTWYANQSIKPALDQQKAMWKSIDDTAHATFVNIFDGGKNAFDKLRDTLKSGLLDLLYQMTIKKWIFNIGASVNGGPGGGSYSGYSGAAGGGIGGAMNMASSASSLYNNAAFAGNALFGSGSGTVASWLTGSSAVAPTSVAYANAVGAMGGDSLGALIAAENMTTSAITAGSAATTAAVAEGAATTAAAAEAGGLAATEGALASIPVYGWIAAAVVAVAAYFGGKGDVELKSRGIEGTFGKEGFSGNTFANMHQDGGWFSSDDDWKDKGGLDNATAKQFSQSYAGIQASSISAAKALGLSADAISNYSKEISITLTNDAAKNAELVTNTFTDLGNDLAAKLAPGIASFSKDGETASATLSRLSGSITTANAWLSTLKQRLFQISLAGGDAASQLADAFGGLQNLTAASKSFYDLYYTEGERAARSTADMTAALAQFNLSLPATKDQLRDMAASLDLNTASGRAAYATLLAIAPEFASVADITAKLAKETADKLMATFTGGGQLMPALNAASLGVISLSSGLDAGLTGSMADALADAVDLAAGFIDVQVSAGALTGGIGALIGGLSDTEAHAVALATGLTDVQVRSAALSGGMSGLIGSMSDTQIHAVALATGFTDAQIRAGALTSGMSSMGQAAGTISTLFLDAKSGLISFGGGVSALQPTFTGAQLAGLLLTNEIDNLRAGADKARIDIAGLGAALAGVNTETFVTTMGLVFDNLAARIKGVIDGIGNERIAVREAALQIINPTVMSKAAIQTGITGINTKLPSNAAVVSSLGAINSAAAQQAGIDADKAWQTKLYAPLIDSNLALYNKSRADSLSSLAAFKGILGTVRKSGNYNEIAENFAAGIKFRAGGYSTTSAGGQTAQNNNTYAAYASQFDTAKSALETYTSLSNAYAKELGLLATRQATATAQTNAAAAAAKAAQLAYADALQNFAIDASKSVSKLSKLREETVKYYEAQKQLADLMSNSAAGLRSTVSDYKYNQLSPEQQFNDLQAKYATAYAMALSTDGEALAGYGDKLNSMLNPLLAKAKEVYGTDAAYNTFASTALARADTIATRLDTLTPTNYSADSLAMLGQIDSTLAALDDSSKSAEKLITDAIKAGSDKTAGGLHAVVAALTGQAIPGFATGGDFGGGLRIVGENGPELEATGPSRIFNASQTRAMLSGGGNAEVVAELRALRQDNANMRAELRAIATSSAKTARQLERWDQDSLPVRNDKDTPVFTKVTT